jgi:hypothetical protein
LFPSASVGSTEAISHQSTSVSFELRAQRDQATMLNVIGRPLMDTGRPHGAEDEFSAALTILRELAKGHPTPAGSRSLLAQVHTKLATVPQHIRRGLIRPSALPGLADGAQNDLLSLRRRRIVPRDGEICLPQDTARIES